MAVPLALSEPPNTVTQSHGPNPRTCTGHNVEGMLIVFEVPQDLTNTASIRGALAGGIRGVSSVFVPATTGSLSLRPYLSYVSGHEAIRCGTNWRSVHNSKLFFVGSFLGT